MEKQIKNHYSNLAKKIDQLALEEFKNKGFNDQVRRLRLLLELVREQYSNEKFKLSSLHHSS